MTATTDREALAGYRRDVIEAAGVMVVGAGALGQNVIQTLALTGVGTITIVDHDRFESHNLTRSPLFPHGSGDVHQGELKADVVAVEARRIARAPSASILSVPMRVEEVELGAIASTSVVVSAVDNLEARHHLARICRLLGVPLVEGGMHGHLISISSFDTCQGSPCYSCTTTRGLGSVPCSAAAAADGPTGAIPATQATASIAAGLVAEQVIELLHDRSQLIGRRFILDIRGLHARTTALATRRGCPNHLPVVRHDARPCPTSRIALVEELVGGGELVLPCPLVTAAPCPRCGEPGHPMQATWQWAVAPNCAACAGLAPAEPVRDLMFEVIEHIAGPDLRDRHELKLVSLGVVPGSVAAVRTGGTVTVTPLT